MFEISAERKLKLLRNARYLCESCGSYSPFLTVHHRIPKRDMDKIPQEELKKDENLRVLCEKCHRGIHNKDTILEEDECNFILKMMKKHHDFLPELNREEFVKKILRIRGMNRDRKKRTEMVDDLENSGV